MKSFFKLFFFTTVLFSNRLLSQSFSPIAITGFNLDAVAENTTAVSTTGGAIDGSDYVLYSAAYGALYSIANGLPNTGTIASATGTYQLGSYTQNNMLHLTSTQTGTLAFTSPAPYAGISILGFSTEGNVTFDVLVRFTDNSFVNYTNQTFLDWFGAGTPVIAGFDRAGRNSGTPANLTTGNPKMYSVVLPLTCANRAKNVLDLVFTNTATNARLCVMAVSGASAPSFSASSNPVTCLGGTNGSASITASGGIPPYTYTWSTNPLQQTAQAVNLPIGVYTYSTQDNGGCISSATVAITQTINPEPALIVTSNAYSVCSGKSFTLGASGANTYTWAGGTNSNIYSPPSITVGSTTLITYTVAGLTAVNCLRTGSITITINPIPPTSFSATINPLCNNSPQVNLASYVQQTGGVFSGPGVSFGNFTPSITGVGNFVITYSVTDANNCSNSATTSIQVFSLSAPTIIPVSPLCSNASAIQLTTTPTGGTFVGTGISSTGDFSPSIAGGGFHHIVYNITSGPCAANSSVSIQVHAAPVASITASKTFFCKNAQSLFFNGLPTGGTFSGPGMNGAAFNPAQAPVGNNNIIIYKFTDPNGCEDTASIRITVSNCTTLNEQENNTSLLSVFPNPTKGKFSIEVSGNSTIVITNQIGQFVNEFKNDTEQLLRLELNLNAGVYYVNAKNANGNTIRKLVVTD